MYLHVKGRVVIDFDEIIDMDRYGLFDEYGVLITEQAALKTAVCGYISNNIAQMDMELKKLMVKVEE